MVNAIKGNVYIIDSAGVYLTGEIIGKSSAGHIAGPFPDVSIGNVGLYGTGTTSELGISLMSANSTDVIHIKTTSPTGSYDEIAFTYPLKFGERLYVRLLTAGTGYIYF